VNGHSYANRKSSISNFCFARHRKTFTEPFDDPLKYGQSVSQLANLLGGTVLVQRLGDLRAGRRSTPSRIERGLVNPTLPLATPGDLSLVLPYRQMVDILEMLDALEHIAPGIASKHTLLYGVEIKFYSSHVEMREGFETVIDGLYAIGDGAGITRGLLQASMCGVLAADLWRMYWPRWQVFLCYKPGFSKKPGLSFTSQERYRECRRQSKPQAKFSIGQDF
jgi:uncharacterized FAD-dependent dehydrogenase